MKEEFLKLEKYRKRTELWTAVSIAIGVLGFVLFLVSPFLGFALFAGAIIMNVCFINGMRKKYSAAFKHVIVEDALKNIFSDVTFYPETGICKEVIEDTEMMSMGNRFYSDDYVSGTYKGIHFEQSDVCIQNVTSNGKHTTTVTYFQGRWMIFEFNKKFSCELQVRQKGFNYARKTGGWFKERREMYKIELEDEAFNRDFSTYAVDEHEAFYILTPHMMQNIMNLGNSTDGDLLLCFVDNRLHVAVNNGKNAFEPPVFSKINFDRESEKIYDEISVITRFIDEMDLDKELFKL